MLASCIMPTRGRRSFVARAIANFLRQEGADDVELLVLDDGPDSVRDLLPQQPRFRYFQAVERLSLGMKRNLLCREARGEFVIHWDDDDWYPAWRIRHQLEAMRASHVQASGSSTVYYYDPRSADTFQYRYFGPAPFVTGNTLAYRRSCWEDHPFADVQVGEDTRFVRSLTGLSVCDLRDPALCIATLHSGNTSPKSLRGRAWSRVARDVVVGLHEALQREPECRSTSAASAALPLISCIMPTADRRPLIPLALELFAAQDYPRRELIVVDDGSDAVGDLCAQQVGVRYLRAPRPLTIGARRNLACEHAHGELIAHWDDDDWYAPERLSYQAEPILMGRADVTGLESCHTLALADESFWRISPQLHRRMFIGDVHGGTLLYRRALLERGVRYPDRDLAEDAALLTALLRKQARLERIADHELFVYVRHGQNAWRFQPGRFLDPAGWTRSARPTRMAEAILARYRAAVLPRTRDPAPARLESAPPPSPPHRHDAAPLHSDCLGATALLSGQRVIRCERCVVFVASDGYAELLDAALATLARYGQVDDAQRVVFLVDDAPRAEQVAVRHGAAVLYLRALRGHSPAIKAAVYSMAKQIDAQQYLCLDADLLVLRSLRPLFVQHAALGAGRVLIAREATRGRALSLGQALQTIYRASGLERAQLCRAEPALSAHPQVINDGLWVTDREALMAIDRDLRGRPECSAWVHARADVWWRQKAALNLSLAELGCAVELEPSFNVQLHLERVVAERTHDGWQARWRGGHAHVLHFNGSGRAAHGHWQRLLLAKPAAQHAPSANRRMPR